MIALLRGALLYREANRCIVDVRDVGYEVFAPSRCLEEWLGQESPIEVHVSTQVREDAITLYGFSTPVERQVFDKLLAVNGVGPKMALAALDAMSVDFLVRAVEAGDLGALSRIHGVGRKTAQRMALELKGKLPVTFEVPAGGAVYRKNLPGGASDTLGLALERLGFNKTEIQRVHQVLPEQGVQPDAPVADRLRAALKILYEG